MKLIDEYKKNPIIIIPAYCPDEKLLNLIWKIREKVEFPIIIVDDGSGEKYKNIFMLAEKVNNCLIFHNEVNMGKGAALKNGVKYAMTKYPNNSGCITCDADGQHRVEDILAVTKSLIETGRENNTTYYVADIIIKDSSLLKTALANNAYGRNIKDKTSTIADENNAILAINGDYYGFRNSGYVLRNGVIYRDTISNDNYGEDLVIDSEGNFKIINENETSITELESSGATQVFSFGPALVENGESVVDEDDEVGKAMVDNPRTAIGQG